LLLTLLSTLVLFAIAVFGQDKPKYQPTEVQSLRLQVRQKDALLAKRALDDAQTAFQKALTDLNSESEKVKTENNWPKEVSFNPNDLSYTEPAKDPKK
jgi:hypothetical protein